MAGKMSKLLKFTKWNIERINAGAKTQTRRPVKPQPPSGSRIGMKWTYTSGTVVATFLGPNGEPSADAVESPLKIGDVVQLADSRGNPVDTRVRITDVRVEQPQDISEADAIAEGCERHPEHRFTWRNYLGPEPHIWFSGVEPWKRSFASLWGTIYGPQNQFRWDANPWCWVYEFEVAT